MTLRISAFTPRPFDGTGCGVEGVSARVGLAGAGGAEFPVIPGCELLEHDTNPKLSSRRHFQSFFLIDSPVFCTFKRMWDFRRRFLRCLGHFLCLDPDGPLSPNYLVSLAQNALVSRYG